MKKLELTFWGGTDIKYVRYHDTMETLRAEVHRVWRKMGNPGDKAAIVYDSKTGEQLRSMIP